MTDIGRSSRGTSVSPALKLREEINDVLRFWEFLALLGSWPIRSNAISPDVAFHRFGNGVQFQSSISQRRNYHFTRLRV